jgi:glycosyltransferase involved in cell wall biosynthesis
MRSIPRGAQDGAASSVSVVIRTYDSRRWDDLTDAVASVRRQTLRPYEIVVVVDHNPEISCRARDRLRGAVVVENGGPAGASGATSCGIAAARGSIVAFLDDDATAAPDWLEHLVRPYQDDRVLGVGGRIEPAWIGGRPDWFPAEFNWVVGCTFPGGFDAPGPVRSLIGANMSFRRAVLGQIEAFRSGVGAVGTSLLRCEDTESCIRVTQRWPDGILFYEPRALVSHRVPPARANWRYFRSRCFAEGLSKAQMARLFGSQRGLASERRYALRTLPQGLLWNLSVLARHGDAAGLRRAGAIVAGLTCTAAGYFAGTAGYFGGTAAPRRRTMPVSWRSLCVS